MAATAACEPSMIQPRMLVVLPHAGEIWPSTSWATLLGASMAATEHAVEIGVRTGLPPRRENDSDSDRRTKRIGLTESKRAAIVQIGQTYRRVVAAFGGQLDAAKRAARDAAVATMGELTVRYLHRQRGAYGFPSCVTTRSQAFQ